METAKIHPLYSGEPVGDPDSRIWVEDDSGDSPIKLPIRFSLQKPRGEDGNPRDQTNDAAEHMRYAHTLNLPTLTQRPLPRMGKAVLVGGAPSIKDHLDKIRELAADPDNMVFAINWTHTWLIKNGIVPSACVFFEIDAEPEDTLKSAHQDVTYYICSHCHPKTFDELKEYKRVLWHTPPNSPPEERVGQELFKGSALVGGGIGTMTRTLTIALYLGYRSIEMFGCDSSYPDDATSTHVDGYETPADPEKDKIYLYAKVEGTGEIRRFKSMGYLALQVEEFKEYCKVNHHTYSLRVHGDGLLRFTHKNIYPDQYND